MKLPPLKATQKSEIATVFLVEWSNTSAWTYCHSLRSWISHNQTFKTRDEAVSAAFQNGFGAVRLPDGKVVRKP